MKVCHKDEEFGDLIEELQKIEKDMKEVGMVSTLAQETIFLKYKNQLPDQIVSKWLDYTARKRLLNNSTVPDR